MPESYAELINLFLHAIGAVISIACAAIAPTYWKWTK
jgi:hypothetical protein